MKEDSENLKQKTARGLGWGLVNNGTTQLLNLVFGVVLARLLTPSDYGVVGVLTVFTLIAGNLQSGGFTQGLCNMKEPSHRDYNSVFWFNTLISAVLYTVLFLSAPIIADFFHTPELLWLSRFVFLTIPISALSAMSNAYMFKTMMVRETAICGISALLVSGIVGIMLAFMNYSYWALAWQQVIYITVLGIGRFVCSPFRPSLNISFEPVRNMFTFSVRMMLTTILNSISGQVLTFIFGRIFPMSAVGNYSQANKWNMMAGGMLQSTIQQVAQPVMAEVRGDAERSLRILRKMVRFTSFLSFPAMFGLALVSEEFIVTAIGEKWLVTAGMLRVLAIAGSTMPLYALLQNVAISHGRSDIYMWLNVVQILLTIGIVVMMGDYGIKMMVKAVSVFTILYMFVWHFFTKRLTARYHLLLFLRDTIPFALVSASVMAVTWWTTQSLNLYAAVLLVLRMSMAVVLYAGIMRVVSASIINECLNFVFKRK